VAPSVPQNRGAFVQRDYRLSAGVPGVEPVTNETAAHIEKYIEDYGETLVELPEETWDSSVCIWQGKGWDALVDLWTRAEGRSDLVLSARIFESDRGLKFYINMVYAKVRSVVGTESVISPGGGSLDRC
jgi:hypothetical protein